MSSINIIEQICPESRRLVLTQFENVKLSYEQQTGRKPNQIQEELLLINSITKVIEDNSPEQFAHFVNLSKIVASFAQEFGLNRLQTKSLILVAKYHDIGKINISPQILNKAEKLTEQEWQQIKQHPIYSYNILKSTQNISFIATYALFHHERFDGKGYPQGLKGNQIPLLSRIISVFDAYEVMTNGRQYKKPLTQDQALNELLRCSGTQFDPHVVNVFINVLQKNNQVYNHKLNNA